MRQVHIFFSRRNKYDKNNQLLLITSHQTPSSTSHISPNLVANVHGYLDGGVLTPRTLVLERPPYTTFPVQVDHKIL